MEPYKFSNETKNRTDKVKVVIYPWKELLTNSEVSNARLSSTSRLDISSQITNVSFTKTMGTAAGTFSISLTSSPEYGTNDWKDIIKRGYWLVIYMGVNGELSTRSTVSEPNIKNSVEEAKHIRCIGYVDRVEVSAQTLDNRSLDLSYIVTGRDFGIIYEDTEIWHNLFKFDEIMIQSMRTSELNVVGNTRLHTAMSLIHDLFYFPANLPGAKPNDDGSLLEIGLQWLMPKEMLKDIGFNTSVLAQGTFWGNLPGVKDFSHSNCGLAVDQPTDYLSGNGWQQLKRLSIPQYHELFCETTDAGKPRLVFRPIPWGIDQSKYPKNAKFIKLYKDIKEVVTVPAIDLESFQMGEDDNSRYNSFLAVVSTSLINVEDNVGLLDGSGFPKHNKASIRRHGFRPMHTQVDSIVKNEELADGAANRDQLIEFNEILFDYWNNAVFAESGSIIKNGTSDVKIGKVMKFKNDVPYLSTKRYYIEGYTDTFVVEENGCGVWMQDVILTRGFEEEDLKSRNGFSNRNVKFSAPGEFTKRNGSDQE